ncbi:hypothetical protein [Microbacterium sp. A1-JK]|uniref:hypothetical protein n=1 Tax=Microbacterium sp. A1-JK TaxID=3177516 RepID=UPI00388709DC
MSAVEVIFDNDRWIRVPLDYADTPWRDAEEWADWLAESATSGRPDAETVAPLVRSGARAVALFPAAHVWARFWHYPIASIPTGFADVYVQSREPDGTDAEDLLPDPGFTALDPVVEVFSIDGFISAARRHSLPLVLRSEDDAEPAVLPRLEWLGVTPEWVCYLVTNDHDPAAIADREADVEALFRSMAEPRGRETDR